MSAWCGAALSGGYQRGDAGAHCMGASLLTVPSIPVTGSLCLGSGRSLSWQQTGHGRAFPPGFLPTGGVWLVPAPAFPHWSSAALKAGCLKQLRWVLVTAGSRHPWCMGFLPQQHHNWRQDGAGIEEGVLRDMVSGGGGPKAATPTLPRGVEHPHGSPSPVTAVLHPPAPKGTQITAPASSPAPQALCTRGGHAAALPAHPAALAAAVWAGIHPSRQAPIPSLLPSIPPLPAQPAFFNKGLERAQRGLEHPGGTLLVFLFQTLRSLRQTLEIQGPQGSTGRLLFNP